MTYRSKCIVRHDDPTWEEVCLPLTEAGATGIVVTEFYGEWSPDTVGTMRALGPDGIRWQVSWMWGEEWQSVGVMDCPSPKRILAFSISAAIERRS